MDFTDTSQRMGEQGARDFAVHGRHLFAEPLNPRAAARLPTEIRAARRFDASPFLSEQAFDANPQHTDATLAPGATCSAVSKTGQASSRTRRPSSSP